MYPLEASKTEKKNTFLANIPSAPWSIIDIFEDTEDKLGTFNSLFHQSPNP